MHARIRNEKSGRARTASLALALALLITPELFADDYFGVDTTRTPITSLSALTQEFLAQRAQIEPIYPYDIRQFIHPVWQPVLASQDDFPTAFRSGLVSVDRGRCTVYPVTCIQVRALDSIVFVNADGSVFGTVPYTDDSVWNRTAWSDDDYLRWEDPARVGITLYLVTADDLAAADAAAELQTEIDAAAAAESDSSSGGLSRLGGMQNMNSMQSLLDDTYTNLIFAGIQWVTNGVELTIGLPDGGWTNRLDLLVSDDLGPFLWRWRARLDDATNGVSFTWVDTNAPTIDHTFYLLGNAEIDSDGDGLSDAIERYVTKTSPTSVDTDDDGMSDGWEVTNGHNPLDPNDPPNVRGTIGYSGGQTGPVFVLAVETSGSWATNHAVRLDTPGPYRIPNLTATNYWIKAFMDSNGDASNGLDEAWGMFSTNAIEITNMVVGINLSLAVTDTDGDGMPDWWEIQYGLSPNDPSDATGDPDLDGLSNLQEFLFGTNPLVGDTDQDGLSDGEEVRDGLDPLFNPLQSRQTAWTLIYDDQDRLERVESSASSIQMGYDAAANLIDVVCSKGK